MKKITIFSLVVLLALFSAVSCGKGGAPKAGSAKAESMLSLLPKDSLGVAMLDLHKILTTELVDKALKDNKNYQKYQEFIKETGIDPQKDIYFLAIGFKGELGGMKQPEAAMVANLRYNKDSLLSVLKKEGKETKEQNYNGVTIYTGSLESDTGKPDCGAFLDESNIVLGNEKSVKAVIDVYQKKADSVLKNDELAAVLKTTKKDAMAWIAILLPAEATKEMVAKNPMLSSLEGVKSLTLHFDYADKAFMAKIRTSGGDEKKNKGLAGLLEGLKTLGAGAAAKDPNIGELLNRIEIGSGPEHVEISVNIPEELINKLKSTAEQKMKGMIPPPSSPAEEKKEEEKKD
jgi:hypothetical protein